MGGRQSNGTGGRTAVQETGRHTASAVTGSGSGGSSSVATGRRESQQPVASLRPLRTSSSLYVEESRSLRERPRARHSDDDAHSSSAPVTRPSIDLGLLLGLRGVVPRIRCPVCQHRVALGEFEEHLGTCLEPKLSYNVSRLDHNAGECVICFEDMCNGDPIARLPCLCVYHQKCIEKWLNIKQCCPEHPTSAPNQTH